MKYCIALILTIALLYSGCSGTKEIPKKDEEKKETPVETEKEVKAIKNVEASERTYILASNIKEIDRLQFSFDQNGKPGNQKKVSTVKYNQKGFLQETIIYNEKGNVENKYTYIYNDTGLRTETLKYNGKGVQDNKYTYEYNEFGNKTKSIRYNNLGEVEKYYLYEYDDEGNLVTDAWYDKSGKLEYMVEYEYDNKGNKTTGFSYDSDENLLYKFEYKYDGKNNLIEEVRVDPKGKKTSMIQHVYKYF